MFDKVEKLMFLAGAVSSTVALSLAFLLTHGFGLKQAGIEQGRWEVEKKYEDPAALKTKVEATQKQIQENIKAQQVRTNIIHEKTKSQQEQVIKMQQDLNELKTTLTPTACISKNMAGMKLRTQIQHTYQMS